MTAVVLRGNARDLPLPDESVDLIVTSPPYFGLRSYTDGGEHYDGQIGSEATPREWLAAMLECTAEWVRVLKPSGSIFVNLGDKYASGGRATYNATWRRDRAGGSTARPQDGFPEKSLLGLPWRYALACMDDLGLILRRDIIWSKPNGLPESVPDRCRSSHEYLFHLVKQPRYYAAVDEIREPHQPHSLVRNRVGGNRPGVDITGHPVKGRSDWEGGLNPLGKLPGSVWDIPSQPLTVPDWLGIDHFAAFPMELPRRCILGWSPPGICVACGEGRRPVADVGEHLQAGHGGTEVGDSARNQFGWASKRSTLRTIADRTITGYACACTPYTDHPGTGEPSGPDARYGDYLGTGGYPKTDGASTSLNRRPKVGPWREYDQDWTPPPTRPALVVDPFGGTGTTSLVASMYGRVGVSFDLSADYCRLARWRTADPAERAKAMQVPKPPPVMERQESMFDLL